MSGDIKPGDLVQVVRGVPCCGSITGVRLGLVFTAGEIHKTQRERICVGCGTLHPPGLVYVMTGLDANNASLMHTLKKIDPPEHGDDLPTRADLPGTIES